MASSNQRKVVFAIGTKIAADYKKAFDELGKEVDKARQKQEKSSDKRQRDEQKMLDAIVKAENKYWDGIKREREKADTARERAAQKATATAAREAKRSADAQLRERTRLARDEDRLLDKKIRDEQRAFATLEREAVRAADGRRRMAEQTAAAHERANQQIMSGQQQLRTSISGVLEGSLQVGRGFVALGLVGEENLAKVRDVLLTTAGAFDLVRGGIKIYGDLTRTVEAYRAVVAAVAVAEGAAAAARVGGAVAGSLGGKGRGSSALDLATGAGLTLAGQRLLSGGAAKVGTGFLSRSVLGVSVSGTVAGGAGVAAAVGGYYGGNALLGGIRDVRKYGLMGGSERGSQNARWGEWYASFFDNGSAANDRRVAARGASIERDRERAAIEQQMYAQRLGGLDRGAELNRARLEAGGLSGNPLDIRANRMNMADARAELERAQQQLGGIRPGDVARQTEASGQVAALHERLVGLQREGVQLEMERARIGKDAAQEQIRSSEVLLGKAQEITRAARSSLESDLEKLGNLDPVQQQRAARIRQRLDAGQGISRQDEQFASQFNEFREKVSSQAIARGRAVGGEATFREGAADFSAARAAERRQKLATDNAKKFADTIDASNKATIDALLAALPEVLEKRDRAIKNYVDRQIFVTQDRERFIRDSESESRRVAGGY